MCDGTLWDPLLSVGPFKFDTPIQRYLKLYNLKFVDDTDEVDNWLTYVTPNESLRIYVEKENIVSIASYECLVYHQKNLIGLSFSEIKKLFGDPDEFGEAVGQATPVEYFSLGLQLWLQGDTVTDITCYGFVQD